MKNANENQCQKPSGANACSKFRVSGYALVPIKVAIEVDSTDEAKAREVAMKIWNEASPQKKSSLVIPGTEDETCVNDFSPSYCDRLDT